MSQLPGYQCLLCHRQSALRRPSRWLSLLLGGSLSLTACQPAASIADRPLPSPARTGAPDVDDRASELSTAREMLRRAAHWLRGQQAADGGWHSPQYGLLRSGQACTPFVLDALAGVPADLWDGDPPERDAALDFIVRHVNRQGVLGVADPDVLEYPNYATAYALICLRAANRPADVELAARMARYLAGEQYGEGRGIPPDSPAYGGWGFGGVLAAGQTGHMDLAHTRRVLQALAAIDVSPEEAAAHRQLLRRAQRFLAVVQRRAGTEHLQPWPPEEAAPGVDRPTSASGVSCDGGFYFSPIVLAANKGRHEPPGAGAGPYYRSYATATCDGLLALLAAGVAADDPRVQDARQWLRAHPRLDYPEGMPVDHPEPWGDALQFYHLAVRAEVYASVGGPAGWREQLSGALRRQQRADGSFRNDRSPLMKEDDPLLATTLAVIALRHLLPQD